MSKKKNLPTCPVCGSRKAACPSLEAACRHLGCPLLAKAMRRDHNLHYMLQPKVLALRGGAPLNRASVEYYPNDDPYLP